jgi:hypothetical protein
MLGMPTYTRNQRQAMLSRGLVPQGHHIKVPELALLDELKWNLRTHQLVIYTVIRIILLRHVQLCSTSAALFMYWRNTLVAVLVADGRAAASQRHWSHHL